MIKEPRKTGNFLWMATLLTAEFCVAFFCVITGSLSLYALLSISGLLFAFFNGH